MHYCMRPSAIVHQVRHGTPGVIVCLAVQASVYDALDECSICVRKFEGLILILVR